MFITWSCTSNPGGNLPRSSSEQPVLASMSGNVRETGLLIVGEVKDINPLDACVWPKYEWVLPA